MIGRVETGDFISVPEVAHRVIELLGRGHGIGEVAARLRAETGTAFAVADFVTELDALGFIAEIDDQAREDQASPRPSLPWLRPEHVRWLLHPLVPAVVACAAVTALVMLATHISLIPSSSWLVWSHHAGLVLAVDAAIAWTLIVVHELAHLATARAAGVPARITLSTRLQFLAAQTDVSGIWAAPRRTRMTVYLAGMSVNVLVASVCLLILGLGGPHGIARQLLGVTETECLLSLLVQFMVFMRTDIYFVLQDLTGCADLYADGSAYLRYITRHAARRVMPSHRLTTDPSRGYPPRQRRAVRAYSVVLIVGTAVCLGVEFAVSVPALIAILARAAAETGGTPAAAADGCAALAVLLALQILWASSWWHRHQHQVRSLTGHYQRSRREVTRHG